MAAGLMVRAQELRRVSGTAGSWSQEGAMSSQGTTGLLALSPARLNRSDVGGSVRAGLASSATRRRGTWEFRVLLRCY